MKEHVAKLWVEMLRSGKYPQTTGRLMKEAWDDSEPSNSYCCLGVLTLLHETVARAQIDWTDAMPSGATTAWCGARESREYSIKVVPGDRPFLHRTLFDIKKAIIKDPEGTGYTDMTDTNIGLSMLNDRLKWDFNKIADFIEEYWERL